MKLQVSKPAALIPFTLLAIHEKHKPASCCPARGDEGSAGGSTSAVAGGGNSVGLSISKDPMKSIRAAFTWIALVGAIVLFALLAAAFGDEDCAVTAERDSKGL